MILLKNIPRCAYETYDTWGYRSKSTPRVLALQEDDEPNVQLFVMIRPSPNRQDRVVVGGLQIKEHHYGMSQDFANQALLIMPQIKHHQSVR